MDARTRERGARARERERYSHLPARERRVRRVRLLLKFESERDENSPGLCARERAKVRKYRARDTREKIPRNVKNTPGNRAELITAFSVEYG